MFDIEMWKNGIVYGAEIGEPERRRTLVPDDLPLETPQPQRRETPAPIEPVKQPEKVPG